ncbi:MAG: hypothetical protein QGI83_03970 [Candidatus Latescibacteria bacterium]|jgi:hypothetical protein|nr:hypothetical protein [Candidatus Latescibacterota bacterium]
MSSSPVSSPRRLPSKPNLEQLKNQAKDLRDAHRAGSSEAYQRIRASLRRLSGASDSNIRDARFTLRDAQSVVAREYGFTSWAKLKAHVEGSGTQDDARAHILEMVSESPEAVARAILSMQGDPQQVGTLMVALGQDTTAELLRYMNDRDLEWVTQAIAVLEEKGAAVQHRALAAFVQRLAEGEPSSQDQAASAYGDFVLGALDRVVGRRRASQILERQGISVKEETKQRKPKLTKQYLAMKRGLARKLKTTPSTRMDLDEIRQVMVQMGEIARAEGILALEDYFKSPTDIEGLFCNGMRLAIDGTERAQLADMLEIQKNAMVSSLDTRCQMIIAGVMAIQDGVNPRIIDQKMVSFRTTTESPPIGP